MVALSIPDEVQCSHEENSQKFSLDFHPRFCVDREKFYDIVGLPFSTVIVYLRIQNGVHSCSVPHSLYKHVSLFPWQQVCKIVGIS